eukprot:CAMPEP_0114238066 /NCGR_PEP_ID=MMETSP0058-20121206/7727_1 /TAXON_ID=36894 /ORGANISM="Pyramimonas parkeae, CCMP726" /LENGTH=188 /DNA_ID=CAMNT_0001350153 /DNA_START=250 /DNA_END=816 /DNA_ORIENTATION=-
MSALPTDEQSMQVIRKVLDFTWPWALLWLASQQQPVGIVPVKRTSAEWQELLSPDSFKVLVKRGTERAGTSPYDKLFEDGVYTCAGCGAPLFDAKTKFNSGTGWPSFYDILPSVKLTIQPLYCLGDFGARECRCRNCGGHLGHLFTDGPMPTGNRYCINGVALQFQPDSSDAIKLPTVSSADEDMMRP